MSSGRLLRVKWVLRTISMAESRDLLAECLACETPGAVRRLINAAMDRHGLGGLIRAGRY